MSSFGPPVDFALSAALARVTQLVQPGPIRNAAAQLADQPGDDHRIAEVGSAAREILAIAG
jgi:hypothetical protein